MSLAALVRHLCLRAGLPEFRIDVTGLWGAVEGYVIGALESPRASITTLSRHFGFDAVETEGLIRFVMRGRAAVANVSPDDLVAAREGDVLELTRGQETELPQALKWQVARADEDYEAAQVEARRITVDTTRIASESFPMAVPPEEAERRCRRALMEAWTGRESAVFRLPPSRLGLDPADVVMLAHDGRSVPLRLVSIADSDARGIEAVRQDREAYDLPPGAPRPSALSQAVVFGAPDAVLLDLPQLTEDQPAHRPMVFVRIYPAQTAANARRFLRDLERAAPMKITKVLTDNGKAFTDRLFGLRRRAATGQHEFDLLCADLAIEHRLAPPMRPQTNGMVERFNGRIEDVLQSHRFHSGEDLEQTILRYVHLYNSQLPQSVLKGKSPIDALKDWQRQRPELFRKRVYNHAGCDT